MMSQSKKAMDAEGKAAASRREGAVEELLSSEDEDDDEGTRKAMNETENELREAGALDLEPQ